MLQLRNRTGLACSIAVMPDADGVDTLIVAAAGAFSFSGGMLASPAAGAEGDGDEPLEHACSLPKRATDVLVRGHAYAPGGSAIGCDATLAVGARPGRRPLRKTVRVHGDRRWRSRLLRLRPSDPEPFARMPLEWTRAYGGTSQGPDGATHGDERNPLGIGFREPGRRPAIGDLLPNLEPIDRPIASWRDRPEPACFAAIEAHWLPRRAWAGTYDEAWSRGRAPYLPRDFDPRFLQLAPPDQVADGHLAGDEPVELAGMTPDGSVSFRLPGVVPQVSVRIGGAEAACAARLDTLSIEPDDGIVRMLWRASWPCDKCALAIERVDVAMAAVEA
jgi:hypothetical protein